jgi:hypothetical protein
MWDNPPGKEFALQIPRDNGDIVYFEFMPSFLAFGRNMASIPLALAKGDTQTAGQKFGSLFSMPVKLTTEMLSNRDYFGRPIYKDTDTGSTKLKRIGEYAGLQVMHPYIRELYKQITSGKPLYQSISEAIELPFKFSSWDKVKQQQYFDAMDNQAMKRARAKEEIKKIYDQTKELDAEGKKEEADKFFRENIKTKEQYDIYKSLKASDKRARTVASQAAMLQFIKELKDLDAAGRGDEADRLFKETIKDKKQYDLYNTTKKKLGI